MYSFAAMKRALFVLSLVTLPGLAACKDEKPSLNQLADDAKKKEESKKKERDDAIAADKKKLDELLPKVNEKAKEVEKLFAALLPKVPDAKTLKAKKECPDAKINADAPSEEKRRVLVVNHENVYTLAGKGDGTFHTIAVDQGPNLRRSEGKESLLFDRKPPETSDAAKERIAAADYVLGFRYIGVGVFTAFKPSRIEGNGSTPARVDGYTVVFDKESKEQLCHIETWGENLKSRAETLAVGPALYEDAWTMWLHTTNRNLDAVSKALSIEGAPKKK